LYPRWRASIEKPPLLQLKSSGFWGAHYYWTLTFSIRFFFTTRSLIEVHKTHTTHNKAKLKLYEGSISSTFVVVVSDYNF
jgi:hypothetical protein